LATDEGISYIDYPEAVRLHFELMELWGESRKGVDFRELLESALARPRNAVVYENADLIRQAATLCFGLIKNHPWAGGNKRTASFLMDDFLFRNGSELTATSKSLLEMVLAVESDRWKVDEIENWLRANVK
jgi:death-on-curing protein